MKSDSLLIMERHCQSSIEAVKRSVEEYKQALDNNLSDEELRSIYRKLINDTDVFITALKFKQQFE